jgi:hypothetical protein
VLGHGVVAQRRPLAVQRLVGPGQEIREALAVEGPLLLLTGALALLGAAPAWRSALATWTGWLGDRLETRLQGCRGSPGAGSQRACREDGRRGLGSDASGPDGSRKRRARGGVWSGQRWWSPRRPGGPRFRRATRMQRARPLPKSPGQPSTS